MNKHWLWSDRSLKREKQLKEIYGRLKKDYDDEIKNKKIKENLILAKDLLNMEEEK